MTDAVHTAMAIAAILGAVGNGSTGEAARPPITMAVSSHGSGIRLTVVGATDLPFEATYALDVASDSGGGRNHSVQRGRARLVPGKTMALITLNLGNLHGGSWTATLQVDPLGAASYRQSLSSRTMQAEGAPDSRDFR